MPPNDYTNAGQMAEGPFIGIIFDYLIGMPAPVCAKRVGVGVDSVNTKFYQLSERATEDPRVGALLCNLPNKEDEVWKALEFCLFKCSNGVDEFVDFDYRLLEIHGTRKNSRQSIFWKKKPKNCKCSACPLSGPVDIPDRIVTRLFRNKSLSQGWGRTPFKYHYVRCALEAAIVTNRSQNTMTTQMLVRAFLKSFLEKPL